MQAGTHLPDAFQSGVVGKPRASRASRSGRAPHVTPDNPTGARPQQATQRGVGKVFLVGAGPGDPELLTVKALRLISAAEAVVYDHLVGEAVVAQIPATARRVYAGKEAGNHALAQHEINRLLVGLARDGHDVVRLKGGDPFIFGRGGEELQALLAAGIECEVVPGITAAAGAASATGIPLTHREHAQTLVFATGHLKEDAVDLDWPALARPRQTVVIYMGLGALEIICAQLIAHGLAPDTPAAVIHAATTPSQRAVHATVATLPGAVRDSAIRSPALIMIGEVVALDPGLLVAAASVSSG